VHPGKVIDSLFSSSNGDKVSSGIHENVLNRMLGAILPRFDGEGMSVEDEKLRNRPGRMT